MNIQGFPNYSINSLGFVTGPQGELKPFPKEDGYLMVTLYDGETKATKKLHRLVAETFIPNPENFPEVDHIDGDLDNNSVKNLQWISSLDHKDKDIAKDYSFLNPEGELVEIHNLKRFCEDNFLDQSHMTKVHNGKAFSHKNWRKA